jgi:hypothetical protein
MSTSGSGKHFPGRKPVPDLIRDVQRLAAENATNARNLERDPNPKERIVL